MRAALPHLRLLTLPMDQISLLTKYLLPEEKNFLLGQEENGSGTAPPSLKNSRNPREKPFLHFPNTLELIPDHLISKITSQEQEFDTIGMRMFRCTLEARQDFDFALKGFEICTRGKLSCQLLSSKESKKAR